jgi:hypothetical protein
MVHAPFGIAGFGRLSGRPRVGADRLFAEVSAETLVRSPEEAGYRGATASGYPIIKTAGTIAMTERRLVFLSRTGKLIQIPVAEIVGLRTSRVFKSSAAGNRTHLIILTRFGEVGFLVSHTAAWLSAINNVCGRKAQLCRR